MVRLRPFKDEDADIILSWCNNEEDFYKWTAGVIGTYPITRKEFDFVKSLIPFTAFDESGIVGFFTLRNPGKSVNELRFGFVIVDPQKRGKGYGKAMIRQGLKFAFQIYGARRVSLGVFENNPSAYHCYKAVGFQDMISNHVETYRVMNEGWKCLELSMDHNLSII